MAARRAVTTQGTRGAGESETAAGDPRLPQRVAPEARHDGNIVTGPLGSVAETPRTGSWLPIRSYPTSLVFAAMTRTSNRARSAYFTAYVPAVRSMDK